MATATSPVHLRRVGLEGLKHGGGVPSPALCGRDLHLGWDLERAVTDEAVGSWAALEQGRPGRLCAACAQGYWSGPVTAEPSDL